MAGAMERWLMQQQLAVLQLHLHLQHLGETQLKDQPREVKWGLDQAIVLALKVAKWELEVPLHLAEVLPEELLPMANNCFRAR